ncbi:CoA ester lyase [Mycobacterium stomatepiae]|uniref:CoA ester lyase n=2 Tax=Mycobacterium stomatepiae TaxID=470076 RepID=A0A7I7QEU8_9MYCO|nr:CoA ester lyase [Mycobacterium stomatepiae]
MALGSGTDAMVLDWDETVAPHEKQVARRVVVEVLCEKERRLPVWVRINARASNWRMEDLLSLEKVPANRLAGVVLPKTQYPSDISDTRKRLDKRLRIVALVECAHGIHKTPALAATPRVATLALGESSFLIDAGLGHDEHPWIYPRGCLVFACHAANVDPLIDRADTRVADPQYAARSACPASILGLGAKLCISASQIPYINAAFGYNDHQSAWALRVLAAAKKRLSDIRIDGRIVDESRREFARHIVSHTS